ncbi:9257_t:CDS:2 [Funneliformis caledonium]|uniref:9257_t:CDS:1 n=1 Tax=Funneliformis caledonium TaxID=1117310 RepID=A0A9N9GNM7_9GLOM|nr:9257_t:CDS:2 [Funneliformis caledonium]
MDACAKRIRVAELRSPLTFDKSIIRDDVDSELLTKRRCSGRNRRCGPSNSSNDDGDRNKGLFRGIL